MFLFVFHGYGVKFSPKYVGTESEGKSFSPPAADGAFLSLKVETENGDPVACICSDIYCLSSVFFATVCLMVSSQILLFQLCYVK